MSVACQRQEGELRIGTYVWPGYAPLTLARDLGYLDRRMRLAEFSAANEVLQAFRNGAIDVASVTLDEAMQLVGQGHRIRIVAVLDTSDGADMLLARPGIDGLAGLKGRRIGVESTAFGAFLLSRVLGLADLRPGDVEVVYLLPIEQEAAYRAGRIDAAITYQPHSYRLMAAGARRLFDSSQIPGEVVDVLVVRDSLVEQHPDLVAELLRGLFLGFDYLHQFPAEAVARMAKHHGETAEQFIESMNGVRLLGPQENREYFADGGGKLAGILDRLQASMQASGLVQQPVDVARLPDPRPLQAAVR